MRISRRKFRPKVQKEVFVINDMIRVPEVRVITDTGEHFGVLPTAEALSRARGEEKDLVIIQPTANPPIAKIIDFGKFKYERDKEVKEQKAKQKNVDIKGVRLSARIGEHDLEIRQAQAKKFLESGDKVKVEIILRGREHRHTDLAKDIIAKFIADLNKVVPLKVEQPVAKQGAQLTSIITKG